MGKEFCDESFYKSDLDIVVFGNPYPIDPGEGQKFVDEMIKELIFEFLEGGKLFRIRQKREVVISVSFHRLSMNSAIYDGTNGDFETILIEQLNDRRKHFFSASARKGFYQKQNFPLHRKD
jgi:hypothetical protein